MVFPFFFSLGTIDPTRRRDFEELFLELCLPGRGAAGKRGRSLGGYIPKPVGTFETVFCYFFKKHVPPY